jgi:hypothetical protein
MSEPETKSERQPEDKEPMETEKVPTPTDGSPTFEPEVLIGQEQKLSQTGGDGGKFVCQTCKESFNSKVKLEMHESQREATNRKTTKKTTNEKSLRPRN